MNSFEKNPICELLDIQYPIIQGGMVWVSGGKLAAAVSEAGGFGLIGAGSMKPDFLREHIKKAQTLSPKGKFGVNVPLLYHGAQEQIELALELGIKVFFTSAGSPKKFTSLIKDRGGIVFHVVSNPLLAKKCEEAGVDGIVAEGFEAGGHNGRDELTTMTLIPQVRDQIKIPILAAGGIADGRQMAAALCLGADGVQVGSRFLMTDESSAHENFKNAIAQADFSKTKLMMKNVVPVRLLENAFSKKVHELEEKCASNDQLVEFLGKGRAKKGMLEGNLEEGELEVGQVSGMIADQKTAHQVIHDFLHLYQETKNNLS